MGVWRGCRVGTCAHAVIVTGFVFVHDDLAATYHRVDSGVHPTTSKTRKRRVGDQRSGAG